MTYAQYFALVEAHNRAHKPRRSNGRGRVEDATWGDIAALKGVKVGG